MRPGKIERIEYEYIRHGTLCLTANLEIATGHIVSPTVGPRRTEQDFVDHITRTVDGDPDARWIFVLGNLNTHNFNRCMAKPFRWTYKGKVLAA